MDAEGVTRPIEGTAAAEPTGPITRARPKATNQQRRVLRMVLTVHLREPVG